MQYCGWRSLFVTLFSFWLLRSCVSAVSQFMIPIFAAAKDNFARAHAASVGADRIVPDENNPLMHTGWLAPDIYVTMTFWSALKGDEKLAYFRFESPVELHLAITGEITIKRGQVFLLLFEGDVLFQLELTINNKNSRSFCCRRDQSTWKKTDGKWLVLTEFTEKL